MGAANPCISRLVDFRFMATCLQALARAVLSTRVSALAAMLPSRAVASGPAPDNAPCLLQ